ncbi:MAG: hypothetical protein QNK24_14045 [Desulfuromusa sp.]|nr:hypothetical protein [Desulfuromusa sp.]
MSRSNKKSPIIGITTASSEKEDKRIATRSERRINNALLVKANDETALKSKREISNVYGFGKDGKQRIDPDKYPKKMRK